VPASILHSEGTDQFPSLQEDPEKCFHGKPSFLPRSLRSLVSFTLPRPFTSALFLLLPSTLPSATSLYLLQAKLGLLLSIYRAEHTFSFSEPKLQISWYNTLSTGTLFSGMSYHLQSIPKRLCNIWLWKLSTINICDFFFFSQNSCLNVLFAMSTQHRVRKWRRSSIVQGLYMTTRRNTWASSCCHSGLQANSAAQFLIKDEQAQANVV